MLTAPGRAVELESVLALHQSQESRYEGPPELTSTEPEILVSCGNHRVTLPDDALARTVVCGGNRVPLGLDAARGSAEFPFAQQTGDVDAPRRGFDVRDHGHHRSRRAEPDEASDVKTSRGRLTVARTDPDETSECSSRIAPSTVRLPEDASKIDNRSLQSLR